MNWNQKLLKISNKKIKELQEKLSKWNCYNCYHFREWSSLDLEPSYCNSTSYWNLKTFPFFKDMKCFSPSYDYLVQNDPELKELDELRNNSLFHNAKQVKILTGIINDILKTRYNY